MLRTVVAQQSEQFLAELPATLLAIFTGVTECYRRRPTVRFVGVIRELRKHAKLHEVPQHRSLAQTEAQLLPAANFNLPRQHLPAGPDRGHAISVFTRIVA